MDWTRKKLSDVVQLKRGLDLPTRMRRPGSVPVLSAGSTAGWHDEPAVAGPGLVVGRATNLGVPTWCKSDFWPLNTTLYASDFKGNDPKFIYHLFEVLDLSGFDSGSVQPMLNRNYIAKVEVSIPPVPVQRAIAEVLGALDDKIAANDRTRAVSEDLCRAMFASATESGPAVRINEVAALVVRGVAPKYADDGMIVLNQKCVRDQRVSLEQSRRMVPLVSRLDRVLVQNDVLVNSTGQGTLGRVARWLFDDHATVDSHITIVRFDRSMVNPVCAGYGVLEIEAQIGGLAEGSTGQTELKRDLLGGLEIRLPERDRQDALGESLTTMDRLSITLDEESARLAKTRDELLPLLMSGKVRVRDAEKVVEDVV